MKNKSETSKSTLRILGVDPGTATTGWAILCEKDGKIEQLNLVKDSLSQN